MATNGLHSDHSPDLTGRQAAPPMGESPGQLGARATYGRDAAQSSRRRSSTIRRLERNAEIFSRNRSHRVRRANEDVSRLFPHRTRTRSLARIETEQLQQREPQQLLQQRLQTSPEDTGTNLRNNTGLHPTTQPTPQSSLQFGGWKPSIVLGSSLWLEGEDLNAIQIADRKVAQTRLWVDHYHGVPDFVRMHQEAVEERRQLDETAEVNLKPRSTLNSIHASAIQKRLEHLRVVLQTSEFPPEHANIEAAIAGYESGAIPYSNSYTLIWAGRIVDRCPDFDSFTLDRSARLDRYEAEYGPGWLWYEPPLSGGGGTIRGPTIVVKKGICLENLPSWRHGTENMGHYRVNMGFRRRKANVSRGKISLFAQPSLGNDARGANMPKKRRRSTAATNPRTPRTPKTPKTPKTPRIPSMPQPNTSQPGTTFPDPDGPRIYWDTLLDSGATLPCLYENDMAKLGINRSTYAAQSSRSVATADAVITSRVYELDVCVASDPAPHRLLQTPQPRIRAAAAASLNSPATPNSPAATSSPRTKRKHPPQQEDDDEEPTRMRGTIPVIAFAGSSNDFHDTTTTTTTTNGGNGGPNPSDHAPDRLSGILPFHVCYTSSAPGAFKIWMGEDRRDVLGAGRLPGKMRYGEILGEQEEEEEDDDDKKVAKSPENAKGTRRGQGQGRGWPNRDLRTPERVIFEHDFPDGTGRVLRDEDGEGGNVIVCGPRGVDFDHLDATAQDVDVWRLDRKREPANRPTKRRGSEVRKRKGKTGQTEKVVG